MTERKPRQRLYSHVTRSRFLHLEDTLEIGKIRLFVGEYKRGQGASATAYHFLDLDDARVLLADLAWAKPVDFADFKGTTNGDGQPRSRVLKIKAKEDKVWLEVQNGPGQVVGQGAVKPAGKPDAAVSVPLSTWEARKLAHAALAYIRAWEVRHLLDQATAAPAGGDTPAAERTTAPALSACPERSRREVEGTPPPSPPRRKDGDSKSPVPAGSPAPPVTTAPPGGATGQDQLPSPDLGGGAGGGGLPATATGFWTLYNEEGKLAGVAYTHAKNIAAKHGDDWKTALLRLCEAIDEATAQALD